MAKRDTVTDNIVAASGRQLSEDGTIINVAEVTKHTMGGKGCYRVSSTATFTATDKIVDSYIVCIQTLTQTTLAAITPTTTYNSDGSLVGATFSSGINIYGEYESFALTSGEVLVYLG